MNGIQKYLAFSFYKLIWRRKSSLLGLLAVTCSLGIFARLGYQQFLYLQAQNISGLSVFNEMIVPLAGLTIACQMLMSLLVSVQLSPGFHASNQANILQQAGIKPGKLLLAFIFPVFSFGLWPLINFLLICFVLALYSDIELSRLGLTSSGLFLINGIVSLIILMVCLRANRILLAIIQSVLAIAALLVIEASFSFFSSGASSTFVWSGIFHPFLGLREGLLVYADMLGYLGWLLLSTGFCLLIINRNLHRTSRKAQILTLLGGIILMSSGFIPGQLDITNSQRSSLSQALKNKLTLIKDELQITAIIDEQTSREEILRGFQIIQKTFPASTIEFQSRQSLGPELKHAGEYIQFKLGKLQQAVAYPFIQEVKVVFESAINQMLIRKQQWITFIEGHGEASLFAKKSSDLGAFYRSLTAMGWPVAALNLTSMPMISDNTGLLVIASSKQQWLSGEVELVLDYLNKGGNLLLLADPDSFVPEAIESFVGITRLAGTLIDWNGYQSGTPHPAVVIIHSMTQHSVVHNLNSLLAFPWSSGLNKISKDEDPRLIFEPIITTSNNIWSESDVSAEQLSFDQEKGELQQSFVLAMSRYNRHNQQKIIVVGDSHFVSDSAINNYANKQFALNLVSWLTNVSQVELAVSQLDHSIRPTRVGHFIFNWLFSLVLPLIILLLWLVLRWLRGRSYHSITY